MQVQYIQQRSIDKAKWDACIEGASNGLIYGYSVYLDTMATTWDALVLGDYAAVMPLTWRRKFGITYLYQPFATACLGVFGNGLNAQLIEKFLQAIPSKFRYIDIYLNHGNHFSLNSFSLYERTNYVLDLEVSYEKIYEGFRDNIRRNIKKAAQLNCVCRKDVSIDDVLKISREQAATYTNIPAEDYERFKKLYGLLQQKEMAVTYGMIMPNGQLVASCVLFLSHKRVYYILVGNHPNGKTIGASHALINAFIKDYAGQHLLLDFEGSDVRNLAFFYSSFGGVVEKYAGLKLNRLPRILSWLKQ